MVADLFPWWAGWLAPLYLTAASFLASAVAANLIARPALIGWRRHAGDPWYERARRITVARLVVNTNVVLFPAFFLLGAIVMAGPMSRLSPFGLGALAWLAATFGALTAGYPVAKRVHGPRLSPGYWLRGVLAFLLLFYPAAMFMALLSLSLPDRWNLQAVVMWSLGLGVLIFCYLGGTIPLARRLGVLRRPTERLEAIVARASDEVGVRPKHLYVMVTPMSNAVAFPAAGTLCVTDAALEALGDRELEAIAAHELGHLSESRPAVVARASAAVALALLASARPVAGTFGAYGVSTIVLLAVVWMNLVGRFARRMEVRADAIGKKHEGDEGTYARALEQIHRANLIPAHLGKRRNVHPELYDRMLAAGVTPDYARPKRPSPVATTILLCLGLPLGMLAALMVWVIPGLFREAGPGRQMALIRVAALTGGRAPQLGELARIRYLGGDYEAALRLYRAAASVDQDPRYHANVALCLAVLGRCDEAESAYGACLIRTPDRRDFAEWSATLRSVRQAIDDCGKFARSRQASQDAG